MFSEEGKKLFAHSSCLPTCYVNYQILLNFFQNLLNNQIFPKFFFNIY